MRCLLLSLLGLIVIQSNAQNIDRVQLTSEVLGQDRELLIYTPRLYDQSPDKRYEVTYVFDAQARQYFDLVHSNLTFLNNAVPMIVVGVISPERDEDFLPAFKHEETAKMMRGNKGNAQGFMNFLNQEVFSYVGQNYRTLPTKIAIGHSNGGVFISYCLLENPAMFDAYLAISPHLRYDQMQMVDRLNAFDLASIKNEKFVYMCKGNESSKGWNESISKARSIFESDDFNSKIQFQYEFFPNLDHTTVIPTALIKGLNAWFDYRYWNTENLMEYSQYLENKANYKFSEQELAGFIYNRYWAQDYSKAQSLLEWGLKKYPNSEIMTSISKRLENIAGFSTKEQLSFPERCLGIWEGTMYMYKHNKVRDSVNIKFTAAKTEVDSVFIWKTEYLSKTRPLVKDYKLVIDDINKGRYLLDEGNDVKLIETNVGDKLFSVFQVDDILLMSSYQLKGDKLVFEVTSGKHEAQMSFESGSSNDNNEKVMRSLNNYFFPNVQRVVLTKTN